MSTVSTRIPERFQGAAEIPEGNWAWTTDWQGNLIPSGLPSLTAGQAWEYDEQGDLVPTGAPITLDPYWEYDEEGGLMPKTL